MTAKLKDKEKRPFDDVIFMRVNKKWKDSVKMISMKNQVSLAKFIRESVNQAIESTNA